MKKTACFFLLLIALSPLLLIGGVENPPGIENPMTGDLDGGGNSITNVKIKLVGDLDVGGNKITNVVVPVVHSFALSDTNLLYVDFIPWTQYSINLSNVAFYTHGGTRDFHLVDRAFATTDPLDYTLIKSNFQASATVAISNLAYVVATGRTVSAIIQSGTGTNLVVSVRGDETR